MEGVYCMVRVEWDTVPAPAPAGRHTDMEQSRWSA